MYICFSLWWTRPSHRGCIRPSTWILNTGEGFKWFFIIVSTTVLLSRGSPEALCLILAFIRLHSGRGGCCHLCPKLGPDISRPTCVTLCAALPSPLCPITFPPAHHLHSPQELCCSPPMSRYLLCHSSIHFASSLSLQTPPAPSPPPTPPPAAISISVRPDFTASWICTFSSRLPCHSLLSPCCFVLRLCLFVFVFFFFKNVMCGSAVFFFFVSSEVIIERKVSPVCLFMTS